MTVTVNNIEHIESQSVNGVGVIKIFFQPDANIQTALAQVTAIVQTTVRAAAGNNAAAWSSSTPRPPRPSCSSDSAAKLCPTSSAVRPWGKTSCATSWRPLQARPRPIPMAARYARCRSTSTCRGCRSMACRRATSSTPSTRRMSSLPVRHRQDRPAGIPGGDEQRPRSIAELNDLPVKTVNGATIYMRDVAHVRDGFSPRPMSSARTAYTAF
jgi:multidrug efflux pump subunit AcrB